MGFLYQLQSPSGKCYIGVTSRSVQQRWLEHVAESRSGSMRTLGRAIRKYGPENFEVKTLVEADLDYLFELEVKAIEALAPNGYNMTSGGEGAAEMLRAPEIRAKQGLAMRSVWERPGYREQVGARISQRKRGRPITQEHREALSLAATARWARGVPEEHREKARINARKRWSRGE